MIIIAGILEWNQRFYWEKLVIIEAIIMSSFFVDVKPLSVDLSSDDIGFA